MDQQKQNTNYLKKIGSILLKVVLGIFLLVIVLVLLLLTPPVQRFAVNKAENFLEKKLGTRVEIGGISIGLPRKVVLSNIYLEDKTRDTLLYGGSIKVDIALLKLISGEIAVKEVRLTDITAKVKRVLPDTAFNFQFIIDAFAPAQPQPVDTTTAELKMDVDNLYLDNCRAIYKDVVTGNDMFVQIGHFAVGIDSMNVNTPQYDLGTVDLRNVVALVKQSQPLATPEPPAVDSAAAAVPITMKLGFEKINLDDININYANDVSAFYTTFAVDQLVLEGKELDLENRRIHFDRLKLDNTKSAIRLGKKEEAKVVAKEVKQEAEAQANNAWTVKVDNIEINNNDFAFDNDNTPRQPYGIDYAHMKADSFTLHATNFVMNPDSIGALITEGRFREQSGFQLDALKADLLYANNQSYIKDLYLKTPGTQLQRNLVLEYTSYDALVNQFPKTVMDVDISNSYVQVKDILAFAPQLRSQPAFRDKNDVWRLNIRGSGTMERLHFDALQFSGLGNTQLDAHGTLASLADPNQAGGTFVIRRFHTTQSDIALFTGARLSNEQMNLPESFDLNGTINGNAANLSTNLNLLTSAGNATLNGRFSNLTNPAKATYNATLRTAGLQLGSILKNPSMGNLSAVFTATGTGFTPEAINTKFSGTIHNVGFNNYNYRNINLNGSLRKTVFDVKADINDSNIDLTANVSGNFSKTPSFTIDAMIDSVKAMPLHFTTQPLTFRGKIDGEIANADPNNLKADVRILNALLVTADQRIPLDTVQLLADKTPDGGQFIRLSSPIANALLEGQFQLTELATVFQQTINPYYTIATGPLPAVKPYNFRFTIDIGNSPVITSFVPGFVVTEPIHVEGSLATNRGLQGRIASKQLTFSANQIHGLNATINTTPQGLQFAGTIAELKSTNTLVYNTRINATALNNNIDFNLGIDDKAGKRKYFIAGLFTQPNTGHYALQLRPDSLLLNYDQWTVAADNRLLVTPAYINANNFTLAKGVQQLSIQSAPGTGNQPLHVRFTDFRIATLTAFMQSDSLLIDGTLNGGATFNDVLKQPLFTSDITLTDLSLKQDTIGNIRLKVSNTSMERYVADVTLSGRGNDVQITGPLVLQDKDVLLDLNVAIRALQLNSMEGALATFVSDASGTITGNIAVRGTITQPKVQGALNFDKASISTLILGGPLTIDNEKLTVTENGFVFDAFSIRDSANNALTINGNVSTTNFINYKFGLDVDADNFRAVNTTSKDNKIYYGDLYLSTNLHIGGTESAPIVDGSLSINDATDFTIVLPQAEPGVVQREGIVEFVNFDAPENDTLFAAYDSLNQTSNPLGFDITANINISKAANFNIVVDAANGDFLNIKGGGQLSAGLDPSGKISLTGDYEIEQGSYQLSFNFLQRKFEIEKGSKITWLGEPTSAQLAVTAIYVANTAPLDLVQNQVEGTEASVRNRYLQKLPFQVLLKIGGELMKPEITFDVVLPSDRNYNVDPEVISMVNTRLIQLRQEPSELNKQVFAVLLLNRFVGENPFESGGGGFNAGSLARQSVSKLLTEQLNSLAGSLINGVDLNFDVASSDDYTSGDRRSRTDLNVGLSKRLLNNRLTVTVGSNFQLEGPQQTNQSSNNIAGNVSVNYQLSKDGRYMLRFYRKNDYQAVADGYVIETGLGFSMTVDYNRFREVLHPKKVQEEREQRRLERERKIEQ